MVPAYLSDALELRKFSWSLRSTSMEYLQEQRSHLVTFGDRAFSVAGPKLWNNLLLALRKVNSMDTFKRGLKTYLSKRFFFKLIYFS